MEKKEKIISIILIILYCVPYIYMGMLYDYKKRSMIGYYLMVIIFIVSFNYFMTKKNPKMIILGNILSFISSYYFVVNKLPKEWSYYYNVFEYGKFVMIIFLVIGLFQLVLMYSQNKKINE